MHAIWQVGCLKTKLMRLERTMQRARMTVNAHVVVYFKLLLIGTADDQLSNIAAAFMVTRAEIALVVNCLSMMYVAFTIEAGRLRSCDV